MALRFQAEATSLVGIDWRINIYDTEYLGATVRTFKVGGDIFELTYDGADDDRLQYIVPSQLSFTYIIEDALQEELIDNLKTAKEGRYLLEVQYLETTFKPYWRGVLFADQVEVTDQYYPQQVRLTASDDLKALDAIPYKVSETLPYSGLASLGSHLINCVNKVRWMTLNGGTRITFEDFFRSSQQATPVITAATAIAIEHHGLTTTQEGGAIEYPSTYAVLAEVLALMGLRLFQVDGAFATQSIFASEANVSTAKKTPISSTTIGSTSTVARSTFTPGSNYVKEVGWTNGYLHPLSEVRRVYTFKQGGDWGYMHTYNPGIDLIDGGLATLSIFASEAFEAGDPATFRFKVRLGWAANAALTGNSRLVRFRIRATFNLGQYYLNRTATINSTNLSQYPVAGESPASVVNFTYGATTWTTSNTSRVDFITPPLNMKAEGSWEAELGINAPQLPANLSSPTCLVGFDMDALLANGTTTSSYDSQFTNASNSWQQQRIHEVQLLPVDVYEIDGSEALYRVINEADNGRAVLDLPDTQIGDALGYEAINFLKALNGAGNWVPTETWYTDDDATTRSIHRLNCYEALSGQNRTVPTQFGVLHERPAAPVPGLRMDHLMVEDAQYYALFAYTYTAKENTYNVSMWRLDRELDGMTVPDVQILGDVSGPTWGPGGIPPAQIEALQVEQTNTGTTVSAHATKLNLITVSSAVNLNSLQNQADQTVVDVDAIEDTLARLTHTFTPKGEDGAVSTKIVYEQDKVDGMSVTLTGTQTTVASGSGNTQLALTESSPGVLQLNLQDQAATPASSVALYAVGNSGGNRIGINNTNPTATLDVTGTIKSSGTLTTGGNVNGRNMTTDGTKLDGIQALAEVNQLAFTNISVNGTTVTANTKTATFTLLAGTNITLTANTSTRAITIDSGAGGGGGASTEDTELFTIFWDH